MQQFNVHTTTQNSQQGANTASDEHVLAATTSTTSDMPEISASGERSQRRQGVMLVHIRHFYCTLEEMFNPSLRGQSFVVGTGAGRPNEPGRVVDVSPAAMRFGISIGMPLRRAHRLAPRARFMAASYDRYQQILQKLHERYRVYSRIIESLPIADAFIDLGGCETPFDSPVSLAVRLCAEIEEMGLTAQIGIAKGKAIAELASLMSRKDGRHGVLYIPEDREASFVQSLPLSMLLQVRITRKGLSNAVSEVAEHEEPSSRSAEGERKRDQVDAGAVAEMVDHLRDFGITTFAQVALLPEEGLQRRLGYLGSWVHQVARGEDVSFVIPDAPPLVQNARVRFQHAAEADETCAAIRKLADYLSVRLQEQRLKGQTIALILWPNRLRRETRKQVINEDADEMEGAATEETQGGQMLLSRHTDEADVIAHHSLMLFAHYHHSTNRYLQVQVRIGDIATLMPVYYPPPVRTRGRTTRKL